MSRLHTCNGILFCFNKEGNPVIWVNMDGPRRHAKWNKSETERQILYVYSYMKHLK